MISSSLSVVDTILIKGGMISGHLNLILNPLYVLIDNLINDLT